LRRKSLIGTFNSATTTKKKSSESGASSDEGEAKDGNLHPQEGVGRFWGRGIGGTRSPMQMGKLCSSAHTN